MHLLLGHGQLARADVFQRVEFDLFEADNLASHTHFAMAAAGARGDLGGIELLENLHLRVVNSIGEVVAVHAADVGFALVVIEALDMKLARFVEVDGFFVQRGQG